MAKKAARTGKGRRTPATSRRRKTTKKATGRAKAAPRRAKRTARKRPKRAARPATRRTKGARPKTGARSRKPAARRTKAAPRRGGTGRESTLAQTPATGRSVRGITNPMPTRRSTGTGAGAGNTRRIPGLERERRRLREVEESLPGPPSSLNMDTHSSAARTGRAEMRQARREHTQTGPAMTGGDVDADWGDAYAVGDEAPGGDNPTPDQDVVDDIGKALGVQYEDNEELKSSDKIIERDRHRWELDPASSEDYKDRDKE